MHSIVMMALAAVGVSGGPVVVAETPGGAVSDLGSWYAVKAVTAGARAQEPAALAIYDARPNALEDRPVGIFSVSVRDVATPRLQGARALAFRAHGWEEHPVDGALSADVSVFTLERNVFAVVLTLRGVSTPLELSAVLEGTGAATGTAAGNAIALDDGRGRPFGVFAGSTAGAGTTTLVEGTGYRWSGTYPVTANGTIGFVLAFDDAPGAVEARGQAALGGHGAPEGWLAPVQAAWTAYRSSFPSAGAVPQAWADADAIAQATLRMNQNARGGGPGIARSKTHADHFWLLDSSIAALALSEVSAADAFAALEPLILGQVPEAAGDERGLIPNHVDEVGVAPPPAAPGATSAYSAPAVLPVVLRGLWERSAQDGAARTSLERAHRAGAALVDWWMRRRDLDANGLVEANGAVEAEMPESPRFSLWESTANLPLPDSTPRARLNVADLNAWLQWSELELWRTGQILGQDDALRWLDVANLRAALIDDPAQGFWDEEQGVWVDYAFDSSRSKVNQRPRTPSSIWPLATGTGRDQSRVRRAAAEIVSNAQLWGTRGVTSVAMTEIGFSPDVPWRGAVSPWQSYFVLQGMYRYGFEGEAEDLRTRLLDTIAGQPAMFAHYGAFSGVGLEAAGTSTTAAVFVEALRRRYEEETFALSSGGAPTSREGRIRRLYRFSDGAILAEVSVEGTRELPRTRFASTGVLFSTEAVTLTFTDPTGAVGGREISIAFPLLDQADVEITPGAGGAVQTLSLSGAPITVPAMVGDTVRLPHFRYRSERSCGCGAGAGAGGPVGGLVLLVLARAIAIARRKGRSQSGGRPRRLSGDGGV